MGQPSTTPAYPHASRLLPRQPARGDVGGWPAGRLGWGGWIWLRDSPPAAIYTCLCKPLGGSKAPTPPTTRPRYGRVGPGGWMDRDCSRAAAVRHALGGLHRRVRPGRIPAMAEPPPSGGSRASLSCFPLGDVSTLAHGRAGLALHADTRFARTPHRSCTTRTRHAHAGVPGYGGRCLQCVTST